MFAFGATKGEKANVNENIETCTENLRDIYGKLQFPPQIQLFFQHTYSDQIFCIFRIGWTNMFAFGATKGEKANVNENIESCTENLRDIYGKLQFPPQIQIFFQHTYSDQIFCIFRIGWTNMFAFGATKGEKANVNENIETCTEKLRDLHCKLQLPPQI